MHFPSAAAQATIGHISAVLRYPTQPPRQKDTRMSIQEFADAVVAFVQANQAWAAPVAFALAFGESLAFVSLVLPSTVILVGIGGLLGASGIDVWPVVLAAGLGGALGYAVSYWIGLYFNESINNYWPFRAYPAMMQRGREFFEKYGVFGVFLGHFFGPIRAVIPVIAGMASMRQLPFQIANFTSAFLWAVGVIAPSFYGLKWLTGH
jgi:membrane protein DedA with SNARE-associated domain